MERNPFPLTPEVCDQVTFPWLLEARARLTPAGLGMREQRYGIWHEYTWRQLRDRVARIAAGLAELGLDRGERVAYMGDPSVEGLLLTLAAQAIGAVPFGIFPTMPPEAVAYLVQNAGARLFVAEDQEYVDKLLDCGDQVPTIERVVVVDMRGMFAYRDPRLLAWSELEVRGQARRERDPAAWQRWLDALGPDDVAALYYTSGTTGRPKGAMLSHRNILRSWSGPFGDGPDLLPPPNDKDRLIVDIPLGSLAGPLFGLYFPLMYGCIAHVPDELDQAPQALHEVAPTILFGFPRLWEVGASQALVAIETSSRLKKAVYRLALGVRRRAFNYSWANQPVPVHWRVLSGLAYRAVMRPMLDKWGYISLRYVLSGGAPLSPDLVRLWQLWGVNIMELYGMTEVGGLATMQRTRLPRPGIAGKPIRGLDLRLAADGEILVRGPGVFRGYWGLREETAQTVDAEGWLHTGDLGELLADGNLRVVDRKRDVQIMKTGQPVPSSEYEHVLKYSPYIRDAMLIAENRPFLSALLEMDFDNVAEWARANSLVYTGFTNLAQNPRVIALIEGEVAQANATLRERGKLEIKAVRVLPKELDPEDPTEVTATHKIRRRQLADKFADLIEDVYRNEESERIAAQVRGRQRAMSTEQ